MVEEGMALPVDPTRVCRECGGRFLPGGKGRAFRWSLCGRCFAVGQNKTLASIYARDDGVYSLCGPHVPRHEASRDHVRPLARGGRHTRQNLRLAHRRCNELKGAARLTLAEGRRLLRVGRLTGEPSSS
jgi:hypothetical protein